MSTEVGRQTTTEAEQLAASLRRGQQPDSVAGYVFTAIGAAGVNAPYGPDTGVFREDLAKVIGDWAVEGITALASAPEPELPSQRPPAMSTTEALADYDRRVGEGDAQ